MERKATFRFTVVSRTSEDVPLKPTATGHTEQSYEVLWTWKGKEPAATKFWLELPDILTEVVCSALLVRTVTLHEVIE